MKKMLLFILILFSINLNSLWASDDVESFINELNKKWSSKNYEEMIDVIEKRLSKNPDDLVALLAKLDYYININYNQKEIDKIIPKLKEIGNNINWKSVDPALELSFFATIEYVENPSKAKADGYIVGITKEELEELHKEYPNKYYLSDLLLKFSKVKVKTHQGEGSY